MVSGNKYTFNITGTMDGSQITLSKDNQANSYSTFEEDGTTPAIGTDYNGVTKITVDFDGVKCSIVSLDKIVDDLKTKVDSINVVLKETLPMPVGAFWDKKTEMDVLPDSDGWSVIVSSITPTVSNGILSIDTAGTGEGQAYNIESGNIVISNLKRMESRLQVISNDGSATQPSHMLAVGDGVKQFVVLIKTNEIVLFNNTSSPQLIFTGDMTIFRIVKIEMDNVDAKVYVDGNLEHTEPYATIFTGAVNDIRFGDTTSSSTGFNANINYDYVYYNLDVASNPGGTDWVIDGDLVSQEVTITGLFTALDTQTFLPKPTNASQLEWVNTKLRLNVDRVDDTTIKLFALEENDEAFDFEFDIIKADASIT
jgi:hypothetical protein